MTADGKKVLRLEFNSQMVNEKSDVIDRQQKGNR